MEPYPGYYNGIFEYDDVFGYEECFEEEVNGEKSEGEQTMEFIKRIETITANLMDEINTPGASIDGVRIVLEGLVEDIPTMAYCYKENGQPEVYIQLHEIKRYFDSILKINPYLPFLDYKNVYVRLKKANEIAKNISNHDEDGNKVYYNFTEACQFSIKDGRFIQGENFSRNVYAKYIPEANGFYLYEMTNTGLMAIKWNGVPEPWNVTVTTATQNYTIHRLKDIVMK